MMRYQGDVSSSLLIYPGIKYIISIINFTSLNLEMVDFVDWRIENFILTLNYFSLIDIEYLEKSFYFAESTPRVLYVCANVKNIKSCNKAENPHGPNFVALSKNYFWTHWVIIMCGTLCFLSSSIDQITL